jgi:peptide/nickel transport system substrate-binding protein
MKLRQNKVSLNNFYLRNLESFISLVNLDIDKVDRLNKFRTALKILIKKALLITVVSFFVGVGFSSLVWAGDYGDAYVSGSLSDATILIPFLADDSASGGICNLVYNGLTKVDKDLKVVGDLAKDWTITSDKLRIIFKLRDNVFWQDGMKFTSQDVKFTYETILNPDNAVAYVASFQDIEDINIIDDYTIEFVYRKPYAPALLKLGMGIIPKHIFENVDLRNNKYTRSPVGTGPYVLNTWKTDQYMILNSYKDYFEGQPYISKYVERIIPDQAVQFLELITGGIDSMSLNPYQYKYRTDTKKFNERFNKYKYLAHQYTYIGYNLADPMFSDKKVRQALSYAIDKQAIIEGVLMGLGEECTGPFIKNTYAYNEEAKKYPYDPAKARILLAAAGWTDSDRDGVLDKDGVPFKFKLITNQGNKQREDVATIVQRNWQEIGLDVEVQTIAFVTFLKEFVDKRNFQALILGWTMPIDPDCYNVWHSETIKEGGLNFISYKNPEVDRLIEEGRSTYNINKRSKCYQEIHAIIAEEQPYTFLYFPYALPAVNKRFKGIVPAPAGISYDFIHWYVPENEQRYTF